MTNLTTNSTLSHGVLAESGLGRIGAVCKQILNELSALAQRPAEHRRLAALSPRMLDDIGMTVAERDALLR